MWLISVVLSIVLVATFVIDTCAEVYRIRLCKSYESRLEFLRLEYESMRKEAEDQKSELFALRDEAKRLKERLNDRTLC